MTRLTASTYDGSEDPTPWLARMEQLARICHLTEEERTWYVVFHLTGKAGHWYMHTTMEAPMTEWTRFVDSLACNFGANRDVDSDMAPPQHDSHVNNYIDNFITYARRINLDSEQHQVSLFVHGL
jgi:hypothetical protein